MARSKSHKPQEETKVRQSLSSCVPKSRVPGLRAGLFAEGWIPIVNLCDSMYMQNEPLIVENWAGGWGVFRVPWSVSPMQLIFCHLFLCALVNMIPPRVSEMAFNIWIWDFKFDRFNRLVAYTNLKEKSAKLGPTVWFVWPSAKGNVEPLVQKWYKNFKMVTAEYLTKHGAWRSCSQFADLLLHVHVGGCFGLSSHSYK